MVYSIEMALKGTPLKREMEDFEIELEEMRATWD